MQQHTRSIYFDVVKGVAISLMVLGHCIDQANGWNWIVQGTSSSYWPWRIIASFHMPLFMLVSGYFFSHSLAKYGIAQVIRQRALGLLVPSTLWSMLFIGLCYALYHLMYGGVRTPQLHAYLYRPIPALWFLWALFFSCCIVAAVRFWAKDSFWIHTAIIVGTLFVPNVHFFPEVFSVHPFFVVAYYIGQHRDRVTIWLARRGVLLGLFIAFGLIYAILLLGMDNATTVYVSKFSLWGPLGVVEMLYRDTYRLLLGFSGSAVVLILIYYLRPLLKQLSFERDLAYCGTVSLGIYGLNNILCMPPRLLLIDASPSPMRVWIVFVLMMFISMAVMKLLSRWHWSNKWLLGKL